MQIGEGFAGAGVNSAHINVVLGHRDGPVGAAWVTALATPSAGHGRFVAVARPGVAVVPPTLFVNKAAVSGGRHGDLTWGAAQAGIAKALGQALSSRIIDPSAIDYLVLIAAVWVNPEADDEQLVYENNVQATLDALGRATVEHADVDEFLAASASPSNGFFSGPRREER